MKRRATLAAAVLVAVSAVVAALGIAACLGPEERIVFLLYDDAYYYLGVARSLAAGLGSTFDGLHATNGYHPLWCWMLVPLVGSIADPGAAARAVGLLWFALAALVPPALFWALRPRTGVAGAFLAAALVGLQPWLPPGLARPNGLETPLYAVLACLFVGAWERTVPRGGRLRFFLLGTLLGAVILARLDAGLLAVAAAALLLARRARAELVWLTLGAVVVAGPSLLWNQVRFGSPLPVSGRVLSLEAEQERARLGGALSARNLRHRAVVALRDIPHGLVEGAVQGTALARPVRRARLLSALALLALAAAGAAAALRLRKPAGDATADALVLLLLFALLHGAAYAGWLWTSGERRYRLYYFLPQTLALSACLGGALGPLLSRWIVWRPLRAACALLLVLLLGAHLADEARTRWKEAGNDPRPLAGRYVFGWVARTLPHEAVLGARDAGRLGWFAPQRVVNLDGLINDARMLAALREGTEADYLLRSPIRYVLVDRPWLHGFDPSRPEAPPVLREGLAFALWRLGQREDVDVRAVPGATEDWVVTEIVRRARSPRTAAAETISAPRRSGVRP